MKHALLVLAPLLALASLPPAAAEHGTCGPPDGYVVDGLAVWVRPGCLGAVAYIPGSTCAGYLFHGEVVGVHGAAAICGAGVWLP